jgi:hypothetical protein
MFSPGLVLQQLAIKAHFDVATCSNDVATTKNIFNLMGYDKAQEQQVRGHKSTETDNQKQKVMGSNPLTPTKSKAGSILVKMLPASFYINT